MHSAIRVVGSVEHVINSGIVCSIMICCAAYFFQVRCDDASSDDFIAIIMPRDIIFPAKCVADAINFICIILSSDARDCVKAFSCFRAKPSRLSSEGTPSFRSVVDREEDVWTIIVLCSNDRPFSAA